MNVMVSARVPAEIKKQGDRRLKQIGSSVTELVNAAYAYVLEHGKLPNAADAQPQPQNPASPQVKTLTGDDARAFASLWGARCVLEPQTYDGQNFKEALDQAREAYYARFS